MIKHDDATLDAIADMWGREFSTVEIAAKLKIPHGSVCRLARNARLRGDTRFRVRQPAPKSAGTPAPKLVPVRRARVRPAPVEHPCPSPRIFELKARQCKYPITEGPSRVHRFCAKPQLEGYPYCPEHKAVCTGQMRARVR